MNSVEIEEAISLQAEQPFDADDFPFDFLQAFGNKDTTPKRLRSGTSNKSDLGGVLQSNNIHILTCKAGSVSTALATLKSSRATTQAKAKFMRKMQERAYEMRGEQYLLIKSPPASGKSRALMFIALDKLHNQGFKQAIVVVPEKSIGSSLTMSH